MDPTFDNAENQFRDFLSENGSSPQLMWVTPDDVLLTGRKLIYIKKPVPTSNRSLARELFETGMAQQLGVLFATLCNFEGATCCYVWIPVDRSESQYALMPTALKMSAHTGDSRMAGKLISSQTYWRCLQILNRNKQALKGQLFGRSSLRAKS